MEDLRRMMKFATKYEKEFASYMMDCAAETLENDCARLSKELSVFHARDKELDRLFSTLYEDNVSGKISDDRFSRMSAGYEREQGELGEKIKKAQFGLSEMEGKAATVEGFLKAVRQYTRIKKLTARMLNELIERIEVHQAERVDGTWVQRVSIHYHCVGAIDVPDMEQVPFKAVEVNTRKGVSVKSVL